VKARDSWKVVEHPAYPRAAAIGPRMHRGPPNGEKRPGT
jgi:hypothetical protein